MGASEGIPGWPVNGGAYQTCTQTDVYPISDLLLGAGQTQAAYNNVYTVMGVDGKPHTPQEAVEGASATNNHQIYVPSVGEKRGPNLRSRGAKYNWSPIIRSARMRILERIDSHYHGHLIMFRCAIIGAAILSLHTSSVRSDGPHVVSADDLCARAKASFQEGNSKKALAEYDEAIRVDPKSARAYYGRGTLSLFLGNGDKAIPDLSEAIRLNPKNARRVCKSRSRLPIRSGQL